MVGELQAARARHPFLARERPPGVPAFPACSKCGIPLDESIDKGDRCWPCVVGAPINLDAANRRLASVMASPLTAEQHDRWQRALRTVRRLEEVVKAHEEKAKAIRDALSADSLAYMFGMPSIGSECSRLASGPPPHLDNPFPGTPRSSPEAVQRGQRRPHFPK